MRAISCLLAALSFLWVLPVSAEQALKLDRVRGYLIYEDDGSLSKNVARRTDQIVANDENGSSTQMLLDIVVSGPKNSVVDTGAFLYVWVTADSSQVGDRAMVDKGWSISYIGLKSEVVRSVVIDHECEGITLNTRMDIDQNTLGKTLEKRFDITCGD